MRPAIRRFLGAQGGASALEFALMVFPLVLLILGVAEFARAIWAREALQSVAVESARCMGVKQEDCATSGAFSASRTVSFVRAQAAALHLNVPPEGIALSSDTACSGIAGFSRVAITYSFRTAVPLPPLPDGIPINVEACFPNQPATS